MRIGLTMREVKNETYSEVRDALSHDWISYLQYHHFIPVLIPNIINDLEAYLDEMKLDAIILTNGNDLNLKNWPSSDVSPLRDTTEAKILKWTQQNNLPLLGTCRGHQFVAQQFLAQIERFSGNGHISPSESVELKGRWAKDFGSKISVNSFHNYYVSQQDLPDSIEILAVGNKGSVEAFSIRNRKILCLQWHPERYHVDQAVTDTVVTSFLKGTQS